jgi:hypothetical protein
MAKLGKFLFDIFIQRLPIIADKLDGPMYSKGKHVNKSENSILQSKLSEALNPALGRVRFLHFSDRVTQYH